MQAKIASLSKQAVAASRTNVTLILALVMGLCALGLHLWVPNYSWLNVPVENVLHGLSLVAVGLVISGKYQGAEKVSREEAARARQLQAMLSMFMVVKHELHNDMQVVMGNAELATMMVETGTSGAMEKPVRNINEAAALAIERIEQLSVFSASMKTSPAAIDINALMRETAARLTSEVPGIVMLRLELEPLSSRIMVDRNLLSLSLSYLIRLAVKTLSHGGEIVVRTRSASIWVGQEHISATTEIFLVRGLGRSGYTSNAATLDRQQAKYVRILEEARSTTQALVERSGASVLVRPIETSSESLIKIGFVSAVVKGKIKEPVIIDEF